MWITSERDTQNGTEQRTAKNCNNYEPEETGNYGYKSSLEIKKAKNRSQPRSSLECTLDSSAFQSLYC